MLSKGGRASIFAGIRTAIAMVRMILLKKKGPSKKSSPAKKITIEKLVTSPKGKQSTSKKRCEPSPELQRIICQKTAAQGAEVTQRNKKTPKPKVPPTPKPEAGSESEAEDQISQGPENLMP